MAPDQPWHGLETPCDDSDQALFAAAARVTIGNGRTAVFWDSTWLGASPLRFAFPALYALSRRKQRSVAQALSGNQWVHDLRPSIEPTVLTEFISAWTLIANTPPLRPDVPDSIRWALTDNGTYSSKSTYLLHFLGRISAPLSSPGSSR
ncbi:uncharacterized protein LOC104583313 [Brachypodium distachyon]|uniref:uncharacterized protein LOC104583313 n=1 Tax=Brachypodium distachyon TaxID=15368 RepID=UPI00052FF512|nr:uncharacterized protein LOC104583313 [Brachypodium distachyon]|eukprot:XP_010233482.1 uncharacterized protein LOC104583313 [Brachypodium distachyon]